MTRLETVPEESAATGARAFQQSAQRFCVRNCVNQKDRAFPRLDESGDALKIRGNSKMKSIFKGGLLALATAALPAVAYAHTGVGETAGLVHGFSHPISGLDHILAMVMVGVFAFQLGGRAVWAVPATFVLVMAFGGALGIAGVNLPFIETGIALSVVVLGAVVALNVRASTAVAMGIVGLFAIFHGHAHGAEMPENAGGAAYAAGFMIATALLHAVGLATGFLIARIGERQGAFVVRTAGGLTAVAGVAILTGLI
jgi:urease accessory protein